VEIQMKEIRGNLWEYHSRGEWICITTNGYIRKDGRLVMGRGCAKEALQRIPEIAQKLGTLIKDYGNIPFEFPALKIISFPVKEHFRDKADPHLIESSAKAVKRIVEAHKIEKIIIPRPGCGWGHLKWERVKPILEKVFTDDRFVVISFPVPSL